MIIVGDDGGRGGRLPLRQQANDLAECQQRLVDAGALFEAGAAERSARGRLVRRRGRGRGLCARERGAVALRAGQIHQIYRRVEQLEQGFVGVAPGRMAFTRVPLLQHLREPYLEYGVGSGRLVVHVGVGGGAPLVANVQPHLGVLGTAYAERLQAYDVRALLLVLANLQVGFG